MFVRGLLQGPGGDGGGAARRVAGDRRYRGGGCGRVLVDHGAEEGIDRVVEREEDLSIADRELIQTRACDQPDGADRRPAAVCDGSVHGEWRDGGGESGGGESGEGCEQAVATVRADSEV